MLAAGLIAGDPDAFRGDGKGCGGGGRSGDCKPANIEFHGGRNRG